MCIRDRFRDPAQTPVAALSPTEGHRTFKPILRYAKTVKILLLKFTKLLGCAPECLRQFQLSKQMFSAVLTTASLVSTNTKSLFLHH